MLVNPFKWAQRKIVAMIRRGILKYLPIFDSWELRSKRSSGSRTRPIYRTKHQRHMSRMWLASYHAQLRRLRESRQAIN